MNRLSNILFWLLLVLVVFSGCYWVASQLGALLGKTLLLPPRDARIWTLILSALLTPLVTKGLIVLIKRRG